MIYKRYNRLIILKGLAPCALQRYPDFYLLYRGYYADAIPTYSKISTATHTSSFTGAYLAGRVANHENKTDLAINYFKQALVYQPDNIETQKSSLKLCSQSETLKKLCNKLKTQRARCYNSLCFLNVVNRKSH